MIGIIDCGTSSLKEITQNIEKLNYSFKIIKFDEIEDYDFKSFSGIIISGAPTLLTQVNLQEYMNLFKWIKSIDIPILGICFGHQIIGLLYNSEIHIGKRINKKQQIEIVNEDDLFINIDNNSLFREDHCEFITLPKEFVLLAKSHTGNNEAMKHKNKKIYGTQFHPEISSLNGKRILKNFIEICREN